MSKFLYVDSIPHNSQGEPMNETSLCLINVESIVAVDPIIRSASDKHETLYDNFGARSVISISTGLHYICKNLVSDIYVKLDSGSQMLLND